MGERATPSFPELERVSVPRATPCELSVVTPLYRSAACIVELHRRLSAVLSAITPDYEIVMVDDGSPDDGWAIVQGLAATDSHLRCVKLSRNFGQHYALSAGIDHARGRRLVVMDADLQDRPEEISRLHAKALEGYDVVFARRHELTYGVLKKLLSRVFAVVLSYLYGRKVDNSVSNFSMISARVAENFKLLRERNRAYAIFVQWLGFKTAYVDVSHGERFAGESSYTLARQFGFALELIVAQSNKPLVLSVQLGFFMAAASFSAMLYVLARYVFRGIPVEGWTSLIVSLYFLGGLILLSLGVMGLYLGKVFDETKRRPLYVVESTLNFDAPPTQEGRST